MGEAFRILVRVVRGMAFIGEQRGVEPHRFAIGTPVNVQCPTGQLFARIPFSLSKVQKSAFAVFIAQFLHQCGGVITLRGAEGIGVPFGGIAVAHGDEGGFATHRQTHITHVQFGIHGCTQRHHCIPLFGRIGFGDAGRFVNAGDFHLMAERHFALIHTAFNRCSTRRLGRTRQWDMPFACQQAGGGIQANPPRTRKVNLTPRVQIGEIDFGSARAVQRFDIGRKLNQITRHKTRRQSTMAQQLYQQPCRIAARTAGQFQRFFRRLHPGFHADGVVHSLVNQRIQIHQENHAAALGAVDLVEELLE